MATQHQILKLLGTSAPLSRNKLGERLGERYRAFQTQLDRLSHRGLIQDTGDHVYVLTASGSEALKAMDYRMTLKEFAITITEADLIKLDDDAFAKVWDVLGKILQNRYDPKEVQYTLFTGVVNRF